MAYSLPVFNIVATLYPAAGSGGPTRTVSCNLAYGRRVNVQSTGGTVLPGIPVVCMSLLLPPGTDVRGPQNSTGADTVEVPAGSGWLYSVVFVGDIGRGFANEHRIAILLPTFVPTPAP